MAMYEPAFEFMIQHEDPGKTGAIVADNPPGARARFGINSTRHPSALEDGLYDHMTDTEALEYAVTFYKYEFFAPSMGYQIKSQRIANKVFDLSVNCGIRAAGKILQEAVNFVSGIQEVTVDGAVGSRTLDAVNHLPEGELLDGIKQFAVLHYMELVAHNATLQQYLAGWIKRANAG